MDTNFTNQAYASAAGYSTVESLLDEAASNIRRYSKGSSGQRPSGSMRIVKPNSTSNSPRGSMSLGRRRTVMSDRRRMVVIDQTSGAFITTDSVRLPSKPNRPVSWHPSSQLGSQPTVYPSACPMPYPNSNFHIFDLPPTPAAVYSGYTSPASTFSPVSMPFTGYEGQQIPYMDGNMAYIADPHYTQHQQLGGQQMPDYITSSDNTDLSMYSHFDWSNFAVNGFEGTTAPPTPESFLPIQHPDPVFPKEEAIPYHPLSEDTEEDEGEILCGMGLYDSPAMEKTSSIDPQLDNYRSSMMSQMLGSPQRRESSGQGLKLEETWNPPPSDDEEDDEDEDGEGEDDEDGQVASNQTTFHVSDNMNGGSSNSQYALTSRQTDQNNDRINWL